MLRGESSFMQQGDSHTLRPGDAVVCATDRPFARDFAHGLEELVVKVPCDAFETRPRSPSSPRSEPIPAIDMRARSRS
jgi:hypothetical protein